MSQHKGLPVSGYTPVSGDAVALVNRSKELEERVLRFLDELAAVPGVDVRWFSIGRTDIEKGFMAVNRSVFRPARFDLPDEPSPKEMFARGFEQGLRHNYEAGPIDQQIDAAWEALACRT